MKILHIHTSMACGGIEAMICALANEMSKTNDVTLCTIFQRNKNDAFEGKISERVHRHSLGKEKRGFHLAEIFKIYSFIKNGCFDIVHIHGFFYYYIFSIFLMHNDVKFVYTIHSDAVKENTCWDWRLLWLKKKFFKLRWVCPVTISDASKNSFSDLYKINSCKIYNGISSYIKTETEKVLEKYKKTSNTLLFLHPARISEPKNQLVLCRVFNRLIKEGMDVVLIIVGSKQDLDIWSDIEPFISDRIIYLGERTDVRELYFESDAFCLPSIWEGLPVTLLEALSSGCIPICSSVGGIPEVVKNGVNGFLSKDSTEESYYKTVCEFLKLSDDDKNRMKSNCITSFEKFNIKETSKQYCRLYENLCNNSHL